MLANFCGVFPDDLIFEQSFNLAANVLIIPIRFQSLVE
ncbi:hypothetical protein Z946_2267 [Sulfitobacter noctilucicola]|nr:hypothetical protein Z946_2267 [Sulfitobacter noctilucicola]